MLLPAADKVIPAPVPVSWMLAFEVVGLEFNAVSMINPPVAVTLIAVLAVALPVTRALAPKSTLRAAKSVSAPVADFTVLVMIISLDDVRPTVPVVVVVTGPLILIVPAVVVKLSAFVVSVSPDDPTMRFPVDAV
jgi:hypothetical protein